MFVITAYGDSSLLHGNSIKKVLRYVLAKLYNVPIACSINQNLYHTCSRYKPIYPLLILLKILCNFSVVHLVSRHKIQFVSITVLH